MEQVKKVSLAAASAALTARVFEEMKQLPSIVAATKEELCGQTGPGALTFNLGEDALGNTRYATVKVVIHRPAYNVNKFDEEVENWRIERGDKNKKDE